MREKLEKKINNMTLDEINRQLLNENSLILTDKQKQKKNLITKKLLIKKGAAITKQQFLNFKDLKQVRKQEKIDKQSMIAAQFEAGNYGIDGKGKRFALLADRSLERDIVMKKVNKD